MHSLQSCATDEPYTAVQRNHFSKLLEEVWQAAAVGNPYLRWAGGERLRRYRGDGLRRGRSQSLAPPTARDSFAGADGGGAELKSYSNKRKTTVAVYCSTIFKIILHVTVKKLATSVRATCSQSVPKLAHCFVTPCSTAAEIGGRLTLNSPSSSSSSISSRSSSRALRRASNWLPSSRICRF